jgi:hypothetical protein
MRTVLLSSVAALALTFATGSLAPASAQTPTAGNSPSPAGNSAPGTTNPSETPAAQPTAPMAQPSAATQTGPAATNAAPADVPATDQSAPANPAPMKRHHHMHKASNAAYQAPDAGSDQWAHQPGTGESGPASMRASNIDAADTHSEIAPHLPEPKVGEGASPDVLLQAAQAAIAAHHTGTAQQALEMAETRLLDRSTAVGAANTPDQSPRIEAVTNARKALASGDTKGAEAAIQTAMAAAQ